MNAVSLPQVVNWKIDFVEVKAQITLNTLALTHTWHTHCRVNQSAGSKATYAIGILNVFRRRENFGHGYIYWPDNPESIWPCVRTGESVTHKLRLQILTLADVPLFTDSA